MKCLQVLFLTSFFLSTGLSVFCSDKTSQNNSSQKQRPYLHEGGPIFSRGGNWGLGLDPSGGLIDHLMEHNPAALDLLVKQLEVQVVKDTTDKPTQNNHGDKKNPRTFRRTDIDTIDPRLTPLSTPCNPTSSTSQKIQQALIAQASVNRQWEQEFKIMQANQKDNK